MAGAWPSIKTAKALVDEGILRGDPPRSSVTMRGNGASQFIAFDLGDLRAAFSVRPPFPMVNGDTLPIALDFQPD